MTMKWMGHASSGAKGGPINQPLTNPLFYYRLQ